MLGLQYYIIVLYTVNMQIELLLKIETYVTHKSKMVYGFYSVILPSIK